MTLDPKPSYIRASAMDAAHAHMRKYGRKVMNEEDAEVHASQFYRLVHALYCLSSDECVEQGYVRFHEAEQIERAGGNPMIVFDRGWQQMRAAA